MIKELNVYLARLVNGLGLQLALVVLSPLRWTGRGSYLYAFWSSRIFRKAVEGMKEFGCFGYLLPPQYGEVD